MTDQTGAPAGSEAMAASTSATDNPRSLSDMIAEARQAPEEPEQSAESAEVATAEPELASEANAAPADEQATSETQEADPAEKPPLDLPRSWTKDRAEVWNRLDPEAQEILLDQDRKASAEVRRVQNEAAEERKAAKAEREAAEKERLQLAEKAKAYRANAGTAFSDIQTFDDITRMRQEDPLRFQEYQEFLWRHQAAEAEEAEARGRQEQERQHRRSSYEVEQNKLLLEMVPEMGDPKKAVDLRERAVAMLNNDLGLKNDLLGRWMSDDTGHEILSHAGIQRLMADGLKLRDIQSAKVAAVAKPIPPVQRPGTAQPRGSVQSEAFTKTSAKIENGTGDHRDLSALLGAMRRA